MLGVGCYCVSINSQVHTAISLFCSRSCVYWLMCHNTAISLFGSSSVVLYWLMCHAKCMVCRESLFIQLAVCILVVHTDSVNKLVNLWVMRGKITWGRNPLLHAVPDNLGSSCLLKVACFVRALPFFFVQLGFTIVHRS